jgi:hypothetical protein
MRNKLRICIAGMLILSLGGSVAGQAKDKSFFVYVGKGTSGGGWGLRYTVSAGVEFPTDTGFSIPVYLNYFEYPYYTNPGNDWVVSHGVKSEISVAFLLKYSAPWLVSPYVAGGLGPAVIREGQVVLQSRIGTTTVIPSQTGLALFACFKVGVEIHILRELAVGANVGIAIGTDLYSDNLSGQAGIRFHL